MTVVRVELDAAPRINRVNYPRLEAVGLQLDPRVRRVRQADGCRWATAC